METVSFLITGGVLAPQIKISVSATILDLKETIQNVISILVSRQTLSLNGNFLRNDQVIRDINLGAQLPVPLVLRVEPLPGNPKFIIFVKYCVGDFISVWIRETSSVLELKMEIEKLHGVSAQNITLHHFSHEMSDDYALSEYYIHPGCQIQMTVSMDN
ncbi:Ubiquitin family protein [Melia azedarach]|uniref:Ubiquitin family protein n=1 Tax=Melia azedarach TaxID=155640 RepID=A0ACC1YKN2_MELAZ|nr:Ubiquitin family protein [Melia azedarach]